MLRHIKLPSELIDREGLQACRFRPVYNLLVVLYFLKNVSVDSKFTADFSHPIDTSLANFLQSRAAVETMIAGGCIPLSSGNNLSSGSTPSKPEQVAPPRNADARAAAVPEVKNESCPPAQNRSTPAPADFDGNTMPEADQAASGSCIRIGAADSHAAVAATCSNIEQGLMQEGENALAWDKEVERMGASLQAWGIPRKDSASESPVRKDSVVNAALSFHAGFWELHKVTERTSQQCSELAAKLALASQATEQAKAIAEHSINRCNHLLQMHKTQMATLREQMSRYASAAAVRNAPVATLAPSRAASTPARVRGVYVEEPEAETGSSVYYVDSNSEESASEEEPRPRGARQLNGNRVFPRGAAVDEARAVIASGARVELPRHCKGTVPRRTTHAPPTAARGVYYVEPFDESSDSGEQTPSSNKNEEHSMQPLHHLQRCANASGDKGLERSTSRSIPNSVSTRPGVYYVEMSSSSDDAAMDSNSELIPSSRSKVYYVEPSTESSLGDSEADELPSSEGKPSEDLSMPTISMGLMPGGVTAKSRTYYVEDLSDDDPQS